MERFGYIGGCGIQVSMHLKETLAMKDWLDEPMLPNLNDTF